LKLIRNRSLRLLASLALMLSWFVATNHCALGLMTSPEQQVLPNATADKHSAAAEADHDDDCPDHDPACAGHNHGSQAPRGTAPAGCCQSIKAPGPQTPKLLSYDASKYVIQAYLLTAFHVLESLKHQTEPLEIDTGPPGSLSFAESVLQRSILAHAPPFIHQA